MVQPPPLPASGDPAASQAFYGLDELLAMAGQHIGEEITPRTVRLYATEGLIDRPGKDGRRAVYGHRHLLQLLLIRALARRGLSLTAIAPLVVCSDQEIEQQLQQLEEGSGAVPTSQDNKALAYLRSLQDPSLSPTETPASLLPYLGSPLSSPVATSRPSSSSRYPGRSSAASSRWHRFSLAPGVELHLSDSATIPPPGSRREAWLQRLVERLRDQLNAQE
jgi:DNA-binding transcriptional MerR regulator